MQIIYLVPVTRQHKAPVRLVLRRESQILSLQCSPSVNIIWGFFLAGVVIKSINMIFFSVIIGVMNTWQKVLNKRVLKPVPERICRRLYRFLFPKCLNIFVTKNKLGLEWMQENSGSK